MEAPNQRGVLFGIIEIQPKREPRLLMTTVRQPKKVGFIVTVVVVVVIVVVVVVVVVGLL